MMRSVTALTETDDWVQAVGVNSSGKEGVTLTTKKTKHLNRPAANLHEVTWSSRKSGPK